MKAYLHFSYEEGWTMTKKDSWGTQVEITEEEWERYDEHVTQDELWQTHLNHLHNIHKKK